MNVVGKNHFGYRVLHARSKDVFPEKSPLRVVLARAGNRGKFAVWTVDVSGTSPEYSNPQFYMDERDAYQDFFHRKW